jgi:hypothetical protein
MNEQYVEQDDEREGGGAPRSRCVTGRPRRDAQVDALIAGLLQGLPVSKAAEAANLARSTAYEILQVPKVQDRLREARGEALATASRKAAELAGEAVDVLAGLMRGSSSDAVRRLAADSLLTHASRLAADQEVEARIADLNAQLDTMLGARR